MIWAQYNPVRVVLISLYRGGEWRDFDWYLGSPPSERKQSSQTTHSSEGKQGKLCFSIQSNLFVSEINKKCDNVRIPHSSVKNFFRKVTIYV